MLLNQNKHTGFTIVELLIVIVVIGILAAISIVAYNGVQDRARTAAVNADFSANNRIAKVVAAGTGNSPTTIDVLQSSSKLTAAQGIYKLASFCASSTGYALAAETTTGNKYYSLNGTTTVQDNTIDVTNACQGLGIASADKIFIGMPAASCATENGSCTFSGTATIAYGSLALGKFNAKTTLTSPVSCSNAFFGDPASGFGKACYILSY
jgi:prepilin-type N-terminal cleavage/methylation domain-containing protein